MSSITRPILRARLRVWTARQKRRHGKRDHWFKLARQADLKVAGLRRQLKLTPGEGSFGVDWAWGNPNVTGLQAAKVDFACRYLSHDPSKNLTAGQAKQLARAGIWSVVVWETTANRALGGWNAGVADAKEAVKQATACGKPVDRPIYFAVDFDETPQQALLVEHYFEGVNSVLNNQGSAEAPILTPAGVYGGYWAVKRLLDARLVKYAWQTFAWSGGQWDRRAQLQQYSNSHRVAGVSCDFNRAVADDFGQWKP